jgi:PAS domain S-box-containing protein
LPGNIKIPVSISLQFKKVSYYLSLVFVFIGIVVLAGWITGIDRLKVLSPQFISVKVNTAICFLLSGAIMLLQHQDEKKRLAEFLISFFALIVFLTGLLTLLEYNFKLDFGIDELFIKDAPDAVGTLYPGRQTPLNALFFLLFGLSFLPYLRKIKQPAAGQMINLVITITAFMTFVTYVFSTENAYKNYGYLINSFQSSFTFIFLAIAAMFLRPEEGLMKIISSNSIGGKLFRVIFPFCLIVFLLLGWLIFKGEKTGYYIAEFGVSIFIISSVIVFTILLFQTSLNLTARENEQKQTENALTASEEKYRTLIEQASDAILIANEKLQFVEVNKRAVSMFGYTREEFLQLNAGDIAVNEKDELPFKFTDLSDDKSEILEQNFRCKNGTLLPVELNGSKMYNGNYLAIVRNVSGRKKLEKIISGERQVLEMIATGTDIDTILKKILSNYEALSERAVCSILLLDEEGKFVKTPIGPGLPDAYNKLLVGFPVGPENGSCGTAAYRKEMVIVTDITTDPLWAKYIRYLESFDLIACWSCPILDMNNKVMGTFAIYYHEIREPTADDIKLIQRAVSQAKIALERHFNEINIKDKEEKFSKVFHNKGYAYAILDKGRKYVEVNESFENLIEYSREDLIGKTSAEVGINSLEFIQRRDDLLVQLFAKGKIENVEIEFESRSGTEKAILLSVHAINLNDNQHWLLSMVDITDKNKTEKALVASEEKYRTLIDQASDAIFITDPLGRFLIVNSQTFKLTGLTETEILKMTYYDFLFEEEVQKNPLRLKELAEGKTVVAERPMKIKGSKHIDVEITAKLLPDGNLLAFVKDITQRKKERQLVLDSEHRLIRAESMGNLGHGYFDILNNYMHISAGLYKIFGVRPEEFTHTVEGLKAVIHPDDYMILDAVVDTMFNKGEVEVEFRIVQPGGDIRNVLFKTALTKSESGKLIGSFTTALDITETKKAQQQIEDYNQQLRQLTAHLLTIREEERRRIGREIHDDLGQQLTAIKMDVVWLNKKTAEENIIYKNKLSNILQLLDGSNQSVRRILNELKPSILDEYGLADAIEAQANQFTANTGIPVELNGFIPEIKFREETATCIFRVFQESLTNITRYAMAKSVVTSLKLLNNTVIMSVKDDGKGFDIQSTPDKKTFGILGMKERVRALNGRFELESTIGEGTKIKVTLPYQKQDYVF